MTAEQGAHIRRLVEADDVAALRAYLGAHNAAYDPPWSWGWRDRETWETPVHLAVRLGRVGCARELARAAPDTALFRCRRHCRTALHVAAREGHADCVEAILQHVPRAAYLTDLYGRTALHDAAAAGHERCVDHLLAAAPDVARVHAPKGSPLHLAASHGHLGCVDRLLAAAPDQAAAQRLSDEQTPLHCAARQRHVDVAQRLLEAAPYAATLQDEEGRLPLHIAAARGPLPLLKALLDVAPDATRSTDHVGRVPLHAAAYAGRPTYVRLLLAAAPETKLHMTVHGSSPLTCAAMGGNVTCVRLLATPELAMTQCESGWTPLHQAAAGLRVACVRQLVALAPRAALLKNQWGCTPLMWATTRDFKPQDRVEVVRVLAAAVPECVALSGDDTGETPLHMLARDGLAEGVRHVLAVAPSAARALNRYGCTPLHYAVVGESQECVRLLACAAPDTVFVEDAEEEVTPLDIADDETTGTMLLALLRSTRRPLTWFEWGMVDDDHGDLRASLPVALEIGDEQAGCVVERLPQAERDRLRTAVCALSLGDRTRPALPPELVRSIVASTV